VNAVVDTNVVAYYLLGTEPFAEETRRFWRAVAQSFAPTLWAAELANALWMAVRAGVLAREEGHRRLDFAARLRIRSVSPRSLWQGALARAIATDVAVYDTLFVELAARRRLPLVTFDARILKVFPDVACRPGAFVSARS
jgi:predicted nucleic acid-binding protein